MCLFMFCLHNQPLVARGTRQTEQQQLCVYHDVIKAEWDVTRVRFYLL